MPASKKRTTSQPESTKEASVERAMPQEQEFRQHLRALAVNAVRVLIEQVMCEELDQCIGAEWGNARLTEKAAAMAITNMIAHQHRTYRGSFCAQRSRGAIPYAGL